MYLSATEQSDEALLAAAAVDGGQNARDILGNVAEIFSAGDISIPWKRRNRGGMSNVNNDGIAVDCSSRGERPKATKSRFICNRGLLIFFQIQKSLFHQIVELLMN